MQYLGKQRQINCHSSKNNLQNTVGTAKGKKKKKPNTAKNVKKNKKIQWEDS